MTIKKTVVAISWTTALAVGLLSQGQAQERLFDGFADGDAFDGDPVSWLPAEQVICGVGVCCKGRFEVDVEGNLNIWDIRAGGQFDGTTGVVVDAMMQGDVSLRLQGAAPTEGGSIGFFVHLSGCVSAYQAILMSDGRMVITQFPTTLVEEWLDDFDPNSDYLLQLDIVEELIEFRVWKPDEPMPTDPQLEWLEFANESFREGYLGIYSANQSLQERAVVRFFEFSNTPIREAVFRRGDCNDDVHTGIHIRTGIVPGS